MLAGLILEITRFDKYNVRSRSTRERFINFQQTTMKYGDTRIKRRKVEKLNLSDTGTDRYN